MIIIFEKSGVYKIDDRFSLILGKLKASCKTLYLSFKGEFGISSIIKINDIFENYEFNDSPETILNKYPKKSNLLNLRINSTNYRCEILSIKPTGIYIEEVLGNYSSVRKFNNITLLEEYLIYRNKLNSEYPIYIVENEIIEKKNYAIRQKKIIDVMKEELLNSTKIDLNKYMLDFKPYNLSFIIKDRLINIDYSLNDKMPFIKEELPNIIDEPEFFEILGSICNDVVSDKFINEFQHISILLNNLTKFIIEYNIETVETDELLILKYQDILDQVKSNTKINIGEFDGYTRYIDIEDWKNSNKITIKILAKKSKKIIKEAEFKVRIKDLDNELCNNFKFLNIKK